MRSESFLVERRTGNNQHRQLVDAEIIGCAEYGDLIDGIELGEDTLHGFRQHLVAAEVQDFAFTPQDDQHAVLYEADIAGMEIAIPKRRAALHWIAEIAVDGCRA